MIFKIIAITALILSLWSCVGVWMNSKTLGLVLEVFKLKDLREELQRERERANETDN